MKGLIKNNFYCVEGSIKLTILIGFIAMIAAAIVGIYLPSNSIFLSSVIAGLMGAFGALAASAIQKDAVSGWNKFELTMPISRNDIIKARYISFLFYIFIGVFMAIISALLFYAITGAVNIEDAANAFLYGLAFAISIPTFMMPLVLIFGTDKTESLLIVSIFITIILHIGTGILFAPMVKSLPNAMLLLKLCDLVFVILLYFLSYFCSLCLYKKKEL